MGLQELRAGSLQGLDGPTRAAGWQPAGVLRPKMGLQELRAGSPQGFGDLRWAYKSCGLAARRDFET